MCTRWGKIMSVSIRMATFGLAILSAVGISAPASAADLSGFKDAPADYLPGISWTGFYIGAQAGSGWGSSKQTNNFGVTTGDYDIDGFVGGATLGYNYQHGQFVIGVETDFSGANIEGSTTIQCAPGCDSSIDWLWTLRGRLGYDFGGWMPYVTGGLAVANVELQTSGLATNSDTLTGYTVGGGLEVRLDQNWSIKGEYLYVKLDDVETQLPTVLITGEFEDTNILRVGINYKFGDSDSPLK